MRFVGRGHPALRATHAKTLELTRDADVTERATCVLAVRAEAEPAQPLAGPVRITIAVDAAEFTLTARANSSWDPVGPAIVRRSPLRPPDTFATHASAAARDLPRDLTDRLRDPRSVIIVEVERAPSPPCAVLFALDPSRPHDPRLSAELAAADVLVVEDDAAARLLGERVVRGQVEITGRTLVVASRDLPGTTVVAALRQVDVETVGLAPAHAAAAASASRGPVLIAPPGADIRQLLRGTPAGVRIVLAAPAERVPALLRQAHELRGVAGAVLAADATPPRRIGLEDQLSGAQHVHVCLDASAEADSLDPAVRAAIEVLLADHVPTRTAAKALAALTGWERRRAYESVLNWPT